MIDGSQVEWHAGHCNSCCKEYSVVEFAMRPHHDAPRYLVRFCARCAQNLTQVLGHLGFKFKGYKFE